MAEIKTLEYYAVTKLTELEEENSALKNTLKAYQDKVRELQTALDKVANLFSISEISTGKKYIAVYEPFEDEPIYTTIKEIFNLKECGNDE